MAWSHNGICEAKPFQLSYLVKGGENTMDIAVDASVSLDDGPAQGRLSLREVVFISVKVVFICVKSSSST